jgi:hypothetical protein
MSAHRPFSWREQLYGLILAGAIGLGVGFLLSLGQRPAERWVSMLYGAFAGLGISLISRALGRLLQARLDPLAGARRTAAYATLFLVSGVAAWTLAGVGLPDSYLLRPGEPPRPLAVPGPRLPLGARREVAYEAMEIALQPEDRLLLLTDGLAEATTPTGEPLGYPALAALLAAGPEAPTPLAWIDALLDRVRSATQPTLEDDWTALLLERVPPGNS